MVDVPAFLFRIDKFDARSGRHDEILGGLGDVASMMEPVSADVGREGNLHFAGLEVSRGEGSRVAAAGRWS